MRRYILLLSLVFISLKISAQLYDEQRYKQRIFNNSTVQTNIQYGTAPQWIWPYWNEDLKLDVYTPTGDVVTKRPLVILAHSGGFLNGSRSVDNMVALCDSLARLGYVTASIDYRKGFNPLDGESAERAVYRGIQDGKAAVRYFKQYATTYGIDTNYIYFGGMSAGGYIALHVAYMDLESERPASTYGGGTVNNLGCLDCSGNNYNHTSKVRAILDYWGAVQDTTIITSGDIPMMIMHGEHDPTVPFDVGNPFGLFTLPETYGGWPISNRAASMGLDYEFYTSSGNLHMLDGSDNGTFSGNSPNAFWYDTLLPRTRAFLYRMTKPTIQYETLQQQTICFNEQVNLQVTGGLPYYKWYLPATGVAQVMNTNSNQLTISFDEVGNHLIGVVGFNEVYCPSDTLWFEITTHPELVASFTANSIIEGVYSFVNTSVNAQSQTWSFGDGASSTAVDPEHTYTSNGSYTVQLVVEDAFGCTDTTTQTIQVQSLKLDAWSLLDAVSLYPNPVIDHLMIANELLGEVRVTVSDLNGKQIADHLIVSGKTTSQITTTAWKAGVYLITLESEGMIQVKRIVK